MRVILHIGTHRTGSTSTQRTLKARHAELAVLGLHAVEHDAALEGSAPWRLLAEGPVDGEALRERFATYRLLRSRVPGMAPRALEAERRRILDRLAEVARATPDDGGLLISSEALSTLPGEGVDHLLSHFRALTDDVRALAYVREPQSFVTSQVTRRVLGFKSVRAALAAGSFQAGNPPRPMLRRRLSPWIERLGRHAVRIVPFRRGEFEGGDVRRDLLAASGLSSSQIDGLRLQEAPSDANRSMSAEAAITMDRLSRAGAPFEAFARDAQGALTPSPWGFRIHDVFQVFAGARFTVPRRWLPREWATEIRDDLEWLDGLLGRPAFPDAPPWRPEESVGLGDDDDLAADQPSLDLDGFDRHLRTFIARKGAELDQLIAAGFGGADPVTPGPPPQPDPALGPPVSTAWRAQVLFLELLQRRAIARAVLSQSS